MTKKIWPSLQKTERHSLYSPALEMLAGAAAKVIRAGDRVADVARETPNYTTQMLENGKRTLINLDVALGAAYDGTREWVREKNIPRGVAIAAEAAVFYGALCMCQGLFR